MSTPFVFEDLFKEEDSVHDIVRVIRRNIVEMKGLDINSPKTVLDVHDYLHFFQELVGREDAEAKKWLSFCYQFTITEHTSLQFIYNNEPWNPAFHEPYNDITKVYVASYQLYDKQFLLTYQCKDQFYIQK